ncbi:MAG: LacI family transcriptional regulator [Propionibacteriaceae bacterium]|jgi:LacI family transcriptional regulator|nr:LacI family transcriptional regulator [Propionibacteriaceae bacterium]
MAGKRRSGRVSIVDVAKAAGVSVGTVSNTLNRPEIVLEETLTRVREAIDELGYVPSAVARQLRSGVPTSVGAIVLDLRNPFYTDMARGIEDRLNEAGYTLVIGSSDGDGEREERYLSLFETQGVSGIIATTVSGDGEALRRVMERGTPVVLLETSFPDLDVSWVMIDNIAGGRAAAQHLIEQGWTTITMFNGPSEIRQCVERAEGARQALREAGFSDDALVEIDVDTLDVAGGTAAATRWIEDEGNPQGAIFCVNDLVGIGVQRALRQHGGYSPVATPIVGFDDIERIADLAVPLTSVRQPTYDIGHRAASLLLDHDGDVDAQHVMLTPELVPRASTLREGA